MALARRSIDCSHIWPVSAIPERHVTLYQPMLWEVGSILWSKAQFFDNQQVRPHLMARSERRVLRSSHCMDSVPCLVLRVLSEKQLSDSRYRHGTPPDISPQDTNAIAEVSHLIYLGTSPTKGPRIVRRIANIMWLDVSWEQKFNDHAVARFWRIITSLRAVFRSKVGFP